MTRLKAALFALLALGLSGCGTIRGWIISDSVDVVPFLEPTQTATLDELVAHLNAWRAMETLVVRVDLQFETVEQAQEGEARRYRTAQGRLLLARPERIRLNIEAPILSANLAELASDGKHFQLLIHPPDYRSLIRGTNDRSYTEQTAALNEDPELEKAGPIANIRPQHFTDAFLLATVPIEEPDVLAFLEEERIDVPDTRAQAKKNAMVRKSFYVVTAVRRGDSSPRARYWFDRFGELTLARQQVFATDGRFITDIWYSDYLPPHADTGLRLASSVRVERPYDDYSLELNVKPDGIMINRDLPDTAFVVSAPDEWGDSVRLIDLDERGGATP